MACNVQPFFVVNDVELESERDGDAAVYWAASSTWTMLRGCSSFQISAVARRADAVATIDAYLQYSDDGISWKSYTGGSLFSDDPITASNPNESRRANLPDEVLFAAFHRIGMEIKASSGSEQVRARLITAVVPVAARDRTIISTLATTDINGVTVDSLFGNEVEADFAKSVCIIISSDIGSAETAEIAVHGSADGANYVPISNSSLSLNGTSGPTGGIISLGEGAVPPWIQLFLDAKSVGSATNVTATAVLRNF